jgi:hypothetical protein
MSKAVKPRKFLTEVSGAINKRIRLTGSFTEFHKIIKAFEVSSVEAFMQGVISLETAN